MTAVLIRGNAQQLPLPDGSVDLIVTSPPYFNQRKYLDNGESLPGQHGNEATTAEYLASLLTATRECARVLKRTGSMFVVLGDKYSAYTGSKWGHGRNLDGRDRASTLRVPVGGPAAAPTIYGVPNKSLLGMPWRYALACIGGGSSLDDTAVIKALVRDVAAGLLPLGEAERLVDELARTPREGIGLGLRAEIIWHKTNAMPDSASDRVGRTHEQIFHFTRHRNYFTAVDEIREPHARTWKPGRNGGRGGWDRGDHLNANLHTASPNPLGRVPGSVWVWDIPTTPLIVPEWLEHARCCGGRKKPGCLDGLDHHACVDAETEILTRRGWLRHDEIRVGDEVAGCDLDSGTTSWTRCHGVHTYDYDGDLVSVDARTLSMRLTPNHRTIVHAHRGVHRLRGPAEVIDAADLTKNHAIPRAVDWVDDGREKSIGADLAALCAWVAAEGWYGTNTVCLSQSLTANPVKVAEIDALLGRLSEAWDGRSVARNVSMIRASGRWRATVQASSVIRVETFDTEQEALQAAAGWRRELGLDGLLRTERERRYRGTRWVDVVWRLSPALAAEMRRIMPAKMLPIWFGDLPLTEAHATLNAFIAGDGHTRPDGRRSIFQKLRPNLDVLQAIAVRCGYKTTLRLSGGRWVLYLSPPRPARLRQADGTSLVRREHYQGTVWCVTTGTGTFVARRRGTVFVTGNSYPPALVRRIVEGWCPRGICTVCGEGRRPVTEYTGEEGRRPGGGGSYLQIREPGAKDTNLADASLRVRAIIGHVCACTPYTDHPGTGEKLPRKNYGDPAGLGQFAGGDLGNKPRTGPWREYHFDRWTPAPTRPAVILDPYSGTGTSVLVADVLGQTGIGIELSGDYNQLATWRVHDPGERARALEVPRPPKQAAGQEQLEFGAA